MTHARRGGVNIRINVREGDGLNPPCGRHVSSIDVVSEFLVSCAECRLAGVCGRQSPSVTAAFENKAQIMTLVYSLFHMSCREYT